MRRITFIAAACAAIALGAAVPAAAGDEVEHPNDHPHNYFQGNAQDCEDEAFLANAALAGLLTPGETLFDSEPEGEEFPEGVIEGTVYGDDDQFLDVVQLDDSYVITAIVVKGGPAYTLYAVEGTESPWTELHSPPLDGETQYPGISHWFVCGYQDEEPTETPTPTPSESPSESPSETPSESPSESPSETPSETPSESPSESPSGTPSESPTLTPSESPSETPGGELPDTGGSPAGLLALAGALVVAGLLALRHRFVKP
ncbi:LPXTG cell wall anchor domain-containing protein [Jiangella sp. DSM 45060]|uniref:LPXTG cell wall anchor domain-containing protein n=1 Tax=Jiangella sp. DSM 45060 TaxID=1798224 RepID=UPI00087ACDDC|nr:LPXTG cell wall anchor domain-containing protein [Jiangella sp. DSM 45060]SDT40339.1 LPXTG-motif cell wall anchor domain-containing protein [Jiangella sp. DSM 45060]